MTMQVVPLEERQVQTVPAVVDILPVNMEIEIEKAKRARIALDKLFKELLVQGTDFDRVPGTDKPTLLKPGAELLCQVFHLTQGKPEMISCQEDFQNGIFSYTIGIPLYHRETGVLISYGIGAANSKEPKYRYRRSKDEEGVRIENPDPAGEQNTLVKMAAKRALVDGVLKATGASRMFSQDMEDYMLPEKASTKQINYIKSLLRGKKDEEIFAELAAILSRDIAGWDDLTRDEASTAIEALKTNGSGGGVSIPDAPKPKKTNGINWDAFWGSVKNLGFDRDQVHAIASEVFGKEVTSLTEVITSQAEASKFLNVLAKRKHEQS